ncbi:MAG: translation initiation factor IF-2 [Sphingobacteriales bacterium]|nr:translation initiation factor IF-2 [Sphingobacteriales bacterium]
MSELKLPRLLGAAKEFNIGKDTLIDYLIAKGFAGKDELKDSSKLTEQQYRALQQEFSSDKAAKAKSDQIEIPKGNIGERKKKEEEPVIAKKETKKVESETAPAPPPPAPEVVKETKKEEPVEAPVAEVVKIDVPEIERPKVVDKIDLDAIDSSTRPKKVVKKKEEPKKEEPAEKPKKKKEEAKKEVPAPEPEKPAEEEKPSEDIVIENIRAEKLEGPKILGKIELPVDNDTRPKKEDADKEKRKRKRIPIEKKGAGGGEQKREGFQRTGDRKGPPQQGQGQGPGQGRGDNRRPQQGQGGGGRFTVEKRGDRGDHRKREEKEIDQKEIQDKIKETQAKLAGASRGGKSIKAKYRRAKREEAAEQMAHENMDDNKLQVTEFVTVSELANLMDVSFADVISKCMGLGIMVSINQRLDAEVIELVASEFGFDVEFIGVDDAEEMEEVDEEDAPEDLHPRSPIVTIMGHVDHGKTSLLDYIRSANVVAGEAGGITQHIGAYQVTLADGKEITFLDTPGHEAFTAMRARGAKVTDIAVIVVAADDAVMPQTREAISHAQAAGVPMIFAINKIDKDGANPQKIYEQLSQMNLLVEEWGGKYQSQELSAKKGLNVDKLLDKILLEAEILDLKANPDKEASGTIIEATLDKGRGYVATMLVQNGSLRVGDLLVSGQHFGRVKAMFNERNQRMEVARPADPVLILGLNGAPQAGEKFKVYGDEAEAKEVASRRAQILREQGIRAKKHITLDEIGRRLALGNFKELNLIIKGDVDGSVEALSDSLQKLSTEEIGVRVVHKAVGQITESDVLLATASDGIIIGFNVRPSVQANKLAESEGVEIKLYSIIYNAIEEIKSAMEGMLEPTVTEKIVANVEVKEVYRFDKATVAGCFVLDGKITRNSKIRLIRDGIVEYPKGEGQHAELGSLKRYKDDAKEVVSNMECGLTIKNYSDIKVGDVIEAFETEEVKRTL